ncbi:purine nucleoside permease [Stereum hirsutum FP-91666 SS1]|uniref:purine nucleoside permease n=1 Tax=Stereum hirsutum (strain FP-91666) TaxID=721885 RepID=UPI000440A6C0|nr:purine nucleoside permease [Stereum hirsutum FP-91666 SS1]EIM89117.1 purine nucleoside permease [Stereum hirsutum FP-91666 SS1]
MISLSTRAATIKPMVFIISMFKSEEGVWHSIPEFDLLAQNITVPGFSPIFPEAHCTLDGSICQLVTGEAEINAASTISALVHSSSFDLTTTYFLIAGIAGINPKVSTIGSVTFARYAVQVALQYEFDAREIPSGWSTGYFPQGAYAPDQYPRNIYGTEVFEVNDALRQLAIGFAKIATLVDSDAAGISRSNYANDSIFAAAIQPPSVVACDTATSDVYWTGALLGEAFENTTVLFTNGTGSYCSNQQEDNALESLLRATIAGLVDFSRIIIMRTASDWDRPYDDQTPYDNIFGAKPGHDIAVQNLYVAGIKVIEGILDGWSETFEQGVVAQNYIGDIFGSLGGEPDFGPGSIFGSSAPTTK